MSKRWFIGVGVEEGLGLVFQSHIGTADTDVNDFDWASCVKLVYRFTREVTVEEVADTLAKKQNDHVVVHAGIFGAGMIVGAAIVDRVNAWLSNASRGE